MMNKISHTGIVEAIEDGKIIVRIEQTSACSTCKVAGHCSTAKSKEKVIDVCDSEAANHHKIGDNVVIVMSEQNGREAV